MDALFSHLFKVLKDIPIWIIAIAVSLILWLEFNEKSAMQDMRERTVSTEENISKIEKNLDNHIGDTDTEIEKLRTRFTERDDKLSADITDLKQGQARLEAKLDLLLKDRDKK